MNESPSDPLDTPAPAAAPEDGLPMDDLVMAEQWYGQIPLIADVCAEVRRLRAALSQARAAIGKACEIIETGDQRLLASDGPAGNQPPDLSLAEWRTLYVTLDAARVPSGSTT